MTYFTTGAQLQAALNALPNTKTGKFVAFDSFFYGQQYMADYQGKGTLSPIEHFVQIGAARGYKPNATFDPTYYANAFADLKGKGFNSADLLYHFMQYGLDEGRAPSQALAEFDGNFYLAANPDVAAYVNANLDQFGGSVTNGALAHYVKFGGAEGRSGPGTAATAGLGDEQGGVIQIVLAAVQRIQKLTDDQQSRVAGVVVDVFQAQLCHGAAAVAQDLALVAVVAQGVFQQPELGNGHVGDEDGVGLLHLRGKFGIIVFHRFLLCIRLLPWGRPFPLPPRRAPPERRTGCADGC